MGQLFSKDATIYRKFFKEQAKLLGIHVEYRYPIDMEFTTHAQENPKGYSEPQEVDIIFDSSPKLSTLRKLGWVSEDKSDKPYLIQAPFDIPNLQKGCLFILPSPEPLSESRVFKVVDIQVDQVMPDSWYCHVAPKLEEQYAIKTEEDYKDQSYSFLRIDEDAI